jgi:hypothetical protein
MSSAEEFPFAGPGRLAFCFRFEACDCQRSPWLCFALHSMSEIDTGCKVHLQLQHSQLAAQPLNVAV